MPFIDQKIALANDRKKNILKKYELLNSRAQAGRSSPAGDDLQKHIQEEDEDSDEYKTSQASTEEESNASEQGSMSPLASQSSSQGERFK